MKITIEMFKLLSVASQMDASFMALVLSMGKKSQPQDEHFVGSYARFYNINQPKVFPVKEGGQAVKSLVFGELSPMFLTCCLLIYLPQP